MTRTGLRSLGIGVVALALVVLLGGAPGVDLARSGLAAWLVVVALPLGALPVVMAIELAAIPVPAALRLLVALFPGAALVGAAGLGFAVFAPPHFNLAALYSWTDGALHGFAARWFTPGWFEIRTILYLIVWNFLAMVFVTPVTQPSVGRRRIAACGLALHLILGTLASIDWTMSLDPGPNASAFGLLLIALQCAFALTAAFFIGLMSGDRTAIRMLGVMTLAAIAAAAFLQFIQYLVVWSANLPREIVWYQHRFGGLGSALFVVAPFVLIAAAAVLGPSGRSARRWPGVVVTTLLLLLEVADLLWLVTPAWHGRFIVSVLDLLSLAGLCGITGVGALVITRRTMEARHG